MSGLDTIIQLGLIGVILGWAFTIWYDRRRESQRRKEVIEHITTLFKEEIRDNYLFISGTHHIIQPSPGEAPLGYKLPRTGAWQLMMGSDELKYLKPNLLSKISMAYVKLFDFNNLLDRFNFIIALYEGRQTPLDRYSIAYQKLGSETLKALKEAEEELEKGLKKEKRKN